MLPAGRQGRTTSYQLDKQDEWWGLTIAKDIGFCEASISKLLLRLQTINNELEGDYKFNDDQMAGKVLRCIADASIHFQIAAITELDAKEGPPREGVGVVRRFQLPPPVDANGQANGPRPRDLQGMVQHFNMLWIASIRNGYIRQANPTITNRPPSLATTRSTMEGGMLTRVVPPSRQRAGGTGVWRG